MKVQSIQDLKKLIELCQKQGVESIKVDGIEMKLGHKPEPEARKGRQAQANSCKHTPGGITEDTPVIEGELTAEQLLMWSTGLSPDQEEAQ